MSHGDLIPSSHAVTVTHIWHRTHTSSLTIVVSTNSKRALPHALATHSAGNAQQQQALQLPARLTVDMWLTLHAPVVLRSP